MNKEVQFAKILEDVEPGLTRKLEKAIQKSPTGVDIPSVIKLCPDRTPAEVLHGCMFFENAPEGVEFWFGVLEKIEHKGWEE